MRQPKPEPSRPSGLEAAGAGAGPAHDKEAAVPTNPEPSRPASLVPAAAGLEPSLDSSQPPWRDSDAALKAEEEEEEEEKKAHTKLQTYSNGIEPHLIEPRLSPRSSTVDPVTPNGIGIAHHSSVEGEEETEEEEEEEPRQDSTRDSARVSVRDSTRDNTRDSTFSQLSMSSFEEQNFGGVEEERARNGPAGSNSLDLFERVVEAESGAGLTADLAAGGVASPPSPLKRPVSSSLMAVVHPVLDRVSLRQSGCHVRLWAHTY